MPNILWKTAHTQAVKRACVTMISACLLASPALSSTVEFSINLFANDGRTGKGNVIVETSGIDGSNPRLSTSAAPVSILFDALTFCQGASAGEYWLFDSDVNFIVDLDEDSLSDGWVDFFDGLGNELKMSFGSGGGYGSFQLLLAGGGVGATGKYEINRVFGSPGGDTDAQSGGGLPTVPLPAGLPLLLAGLGAIGLLRRARRS